jgi:hypothetical protein
MLEPEKADQNSAFRPMVPPISSRDNETKVDNNGDLAFKTSTTRSLVLMRCCAVEDFSRTSEM